MPIKTSIEGTKALSNQLKDLGKSIEDGTSDELKKSVYILERNLVLGSPVDTGRYRLGWRTIRISRFSYEIRNPIEYAKFLIYGALDRGIQHDVRGVVRYWKAHIYKKAISRITKK